MATEELHLGEIWHATRSPCTGAKGAFESWTRGGLLVGADGKIKAVGDGATLRQAHPGAVLHDHGDAVILPGFVDTHLHFPQLDMIGSYGEQLLGWLQTYTFPHETRFQDEAHAHEVATRLFDELLAHGITSSVIYGSSHKHSADALFEEAERRGVRAVIGKVSMDQMGPTELLQRADQDEKDNEALIGRWHGEGARLYVALTPRFALSCSEQLMTRLGEIKRRHPTVYVQTHHAETIAEIDAVRQLYPKDKTYAAVYDRFGLLGPETILGHSIYATEDELQLMAERDVAIAHCPTSNLFLGSGLFPLQKFTERGIRVSLASDIGAGTSLSMLQTMNEAYKVQQLQGQAVTPGTWLYLATLAGAEALGQSERTGNFVVGKDADFQVLDWRRSRLLKARFDERQTAEQRLFALIMLGNDRLTKAVHVRGKCVYSG